MDSSWRTAITATRHCLTGGAIGEVLGMVIATAAGGGTLASIVISVALAFFFGYLLTFTGVRRSGLPVAAAVRVAPWPADTVPVNRAMIARGLGHAKVHEHHADHPDHGPPPALRRVGGRAQRLSDWACGVAVGRAGVSETGRTGLVPPRIMSPTYPLGGQENHHHPG